MDIWRFFSGHTGRRILAYVVRDNIPVELTSCVPSLDLAALFQSPSDSLLWLNPKQDQLYSYTSPYEVSECSLTNHGLFGVTIQLHIQLQIEALMLIKL